MIQTLCVAWDNWYLPACVAGTESTRQEKTSVLRTQQADPVAKRTFVSGVPSWETQECRVRRTLVFSDRGFQPLVPVRSMLAGWEQKAQHRFDALRPRLFAMFRAFDFQIFQISVEFPAFAYERVTQGAGVFYIALL